MPKAYDGNIHDFCEKKAREGDSGFAVAYALLEVAAQHAKTNYQLERLGLGNAYSGGFGALELIGLSLEKIASSVNDAGSAISDAVNTSGQ